MAGIKISALPAVSAAILTDTFPVVQAGVTDKETLQQVLTLFQANIVTTANGGIVYTDATKVQLLAPTATAGKFLASGSNAAPSWSAATFPITVGAAGTIIRSNGTNNVYSTATFADTYAASTLLYSNGANTVTGLATANNGLLVTSSAGVPSILAGPGTSGNVLQSNAAASPSFSTPTYPSASGTAGKLIRSDGTNNVYSTATFSDTYTASNLLYSNGSNTVTGLPTANNGVLITSAGGVPSISSTLPNAVQANITTVGTIGTGVWNGTPIALAFGGTNANLTASNGGIFYSTATAAAILAGIATAGKVLQSGATAAPTWSTPTYPSASGSAGTILRSDGTNNIYTTSTFADTYAVSTLLYASSANVVSGLATANSSVLITNVSGVPSWGTLTSTLVTSITGTANQVIASSSTGAVTLSLPQSIGTSSVVQFGGLSLGTATVPPTSGALITGNVFIGSSGTAGINLHVKPSSGNATCRLETSTAATTNLSYDLVDSGGTGWTIFQDSASDSDKLKFAKLLGGVFSATYLTLDLNGKLGINTTTPQNKLDINGGVAIGSYGGVNAAPTNGLIVSGQTLIGESSAFVGATFEVGGSDRISFGIGGTKTSTDGASQAGMYFGPTYAPTSNTTSVTSFLSYPQFNPPTGVTITNAYNFFLQTGGQAGLGSVTNGYNLYVDACGFGTNRICAFFNGTVVATSITLSTGAGAGKVWTCIDGTGAGHWV